MTKPIAFLKQNAISIFALVALGAIVWFGATYTPSQPPTPSQTPEQLGGQTPQPSPKQVMVQPNLTASAIVGDAHAPVTIIEYSDYQCPFCERFYTQTFPDLKKQYIDTGKVQFVYQDFPFLSIDSNAAAEATHCAADQGKYWEYHNYLFVHQGQEGSGWAVAANQKIFAKAIGLDMSQFNTCFDGGKYKQLVVDEKNAGSSYGVTGTPSFFINGQLIVGAQPISAFAQIIDPLLKK